MQIVTDRFRQSAVKGGRLATIISCTPPGGDPLALKFSAASVTCSMNSASRYTAPLTLTPISGVDVFGIVTTPGSVFAIDHGFNYGAGQSELLPMGRYELAQDSANVFGGDISVDLVDQWAKLDRVEFLAPFSPPSGSRVDAISAVVHEAIPTVVIRVLTASGGNLVAGNTWDTSRTQFITDMATDGGLDCFFNAAGEFVIRDEPTIRPDAVAWTFRSGSTPNIVTADRSRPFDQLYNRVVVSPQADTQVWAPQIVEITDVDHPLHKSKIGVATYPYQSPSATSASEAFAIARVLLQRIQGTAETLGISSFGNSALEAGDTVAVVKELTEVDPGFADIHFGDSFTFDLVTGGLSADTRTASLADVAAA